MDGERALAMRGPWYAFKTRGRSGWCLTLGLVGLMAAPYISSLVTACLVWYFGVDA